MQVGELQFPQTGFSGSVKLISPEISANENVKDTTKSFQETLGGFIKDVNNLQLSADKEVDKMAAGETADVHDVMIAVEKAKVSFDLLLQVRNKMLDAYKQILQMQI